MMTNQTAFAAPADPIAAPVEARHDNRKQLLWSGVLQTARGPCPCTVMDISRGGARLAMGPAVKVGQAVTLVVTGMGMFRGAVVWEEAGSLGIQFSEEGSAGAA